MHITPAAPIPLGRPTPADHARACDVLSTIHGRQVTGGYTVEQLAQAFADCYAAGYDAGQRMSVPSPRPIPREERAK